MKKTLITCDKFYSDTISKILKTGSMDVNPRPKYLDGTPAHTLSINHVMPSYESYEMPLSTLRPIATKSAIGELLWIYADQSSDLKLLKDKYGITWWDSWDLGDRTIGN